MDKDSVNTFVKVLEHYGLFDGDLKYKIVCPFHEDVNASLLIDVSDARWFCFGCQKGGGALELIASFEKVDPMQHWKLLYGIIAGSAKHDYTVKLKTPQQIRKEKELLELRAQDYYFNLRTVDWETVEDPVKPYLLKRGFSVQTLNRIKAKLTYNEAYPVVFPMNDSGAFRGWVCRTTNKLVEEKRKYLYNKGFSRIDTLVGKYDSETVWAVEGYMDYLKAKQFGIKYVAALLGWKATEIQLQKLQQAGVKRIIGALDNDKCGQKGQAFLRKHFEVIDFPYPWGIKDLGEMTAISFNKAVCKQKLGRFINGNT